MPADPSERVLREIDKATEEVVSFAGDLVRIPTINPPGQDYEPCALFVGAALARGGFTVDYLTADTRPEHTATHPRINVVGSRRGDAAHPLVHLNGHLDVVPAGAGWTVDPFAGIVRDGRLYGRGSSDMKGGLAAAVFAAEAIHRAGVRLPGTLEVSATADEESGGFAGVGWLTACGRIEAGRTDYVIIPEPLNVDRICIGHRGVHWIELVTEGRIAHGSMPFLGVNAIDHMQRLLQAIRDELAPALAARTTAMPVVPAAARHATININAISGGQPVDGLQTPCVPDRCHAILDRRFLLEEGFEASRAELLDLLERTAARVPRLRYRATDVMVVHPVQTPEDSPLRPALSGAIRRVLGREAVYVASPGTYDHKHVARAGVAHCAAYGPGILELAHQPDEWCGVDDIVAATKVLALATLELMGVTQPSSTRTG